MTFSPDPRKNPIAKPVVDALEAAGKTAEGYSLYTYGAIQAWAAGRRPRPAPIDFDPVVAELAAGNFDTVLGDVKFDAKGDVTLPGYVFYEWKNGTYDYLEVSRDPAPSRTDGNPGGNAGVFLLARGA